MSMPISYLCCSASTAAYPQAFAPVLEAGPAYNSLSYSIFDKVLWQASAGQINRWRKNTLRIKPTTFEKMQQRQVPFIYNFSQAVVPPPLDWSSLIRISGYWFLDQPDLTWQPEQSLLDFMQKARSDNVPLVYAGFGSITIKDVEAVIEHIYEAALTANVRVILSRGWSARNKDGTNKQIQLKHPPTNVYLVDSIPHVRALHVVLALFDADRWDFRTGSSLKSTLLCITEEQELLAQAYGRVYLLSSNRFSGINFSGLRESRSSAWASACRRLQRMTSLKPSALQRAHVSCKRKPKTWESAFVRKTAAEML